jgi:hypothetical protein
MVPSRASAARRRTEKTSAVCEQIRLRISAPQTVEAEEDPVARAAGLMRAHLQLPAA